MTAGCFRLPHSSKINQFTDIKPDKALALTLTDTFHLSGSDQKPV